MQVPHQENVITYLLPLQQAFPARLRRAGGFVNALRHVAGPAQGLKPRRIPNILIRETMKRHHMIAFQFPGASTLPATPLITVEDDKPQPLPSLAIRVDRMKRNRDALTRPKERSPTLGLACCRQPSATAKIAAATASSRSLNRRPPCVPLLSFALPAGSQTVRDSTIADRSRSEGEGITRPSERGHARPLQPLCTAVSRPFHGAFSEEDRVRPAVQSHTVYRPWSLCEHSDSATTRPR